MYQTDDADRGLKQSMRGDKAQEGIHFSDCLKCFFLLTCVICSLFFNGSSKYARGKVKALLIYQLIKCKVI